MLKLYLQDYGVYGCTIVAAENQEQAREMLQGTYNYDSDKEIEEIEVVPGIILENLGDR